jgi:hypothetical protein
VFLYFAPLALLPYLTDVLLTLLWRARRGRSLLDAHRDHLYQLWLARTGRPHLALAWRSWLVIGASAGLALLDQNLPRSVQPAVFAAATAASALAWYVARRRLTPRP